MEGKKISIQGVRAFLVVLKNPEKWITSKELSNKALIAERTARAFCLKFTKLGFLEVVHVFPAAKYRFSSRAINLNTGYISRFEKACIGFGLRDSFRRTCKILLGKAHL